MAILGYASPPNGSSKYTSSPWELELAPVTLTDNNALISSMSGTIASTCYQTFKFGIYSSSLQLLAQTNQVGTGYATGGSTQSANLITPVTLQAGNYYLSVMNGNGSSLYFYYKSGTCYYQSITSAQYALGFPASLAGLGTSYGKFMQVWATYTISSGSTGAKNNLCVMT